MNLQVFQTDFKALVTTINTVRHYLQNTVEIHVNWIYRYNRLILHLIVAVRYYLQNTFRNHVNWIYRYFILILHLVVAVKYCLQNTFKIHVNWINRYFRLILKPLVPAINTGETLPSKHSWNPCKLNLKELYTDFTSHCGREKLSSKHI